MVKLFFNTTTIVEIPPTNFRDLINHVTGTTDLNSDDFYFEQNGKRLQDNPSVDSPIYVRLRILGGKGGFGSMLRAIGAQIEKTTNREACRDLSGRRLRDINEEKRLKAWLDKQGEREREAEERKKRKIEKLLAVPKHEFKDEEYEEARSKLTEKVCDAVEVGMKKSNGATSDLKRKHEPCTSQQAATKAKNKKLSLWIDDLSDDSEDSSDDDDQICDKNKKNIECKTKDGGTINSEDESNSSSSKQSLLNGVANSSDSEPASTVSK